MKRTARTNARHRTTTQHAKPRRLLTALGTVIGALPLVHKLFRTAQALEALLDMLLGA